MYPRLLGCLTFVFALSAACTSSPTDAPTDDVEDAGAHDARADRSVGHDLVPDRPAPADSGGADHQTDAPGGPDMETVQVIFSGFCVRCHDTNVIPRPESFAFPMLPLTPGAARAALVNKRASEECGGVLVVPGHSDQSYLIKKLTEAAPCFGKRMPHPGMLASAPPLPAKDIAIIAAWIDGGARP